MKLKYFFPILIFTFFYTLSATAQVPQSERDALMAFYNATNGDNWTDNTNWGSAEPVSDWFGVTVGNTSIGEAVAFLRIANNNLSGDISSTNLSALTKLQILNLAANDIMGELTIGTENLRSLNVSATALSTVTVTQIITGQTDFTNFVGARETPNLNCIQVPSRAIPSIYNTGKGLFDFGDVFTDDCANEPLYPLAEQRAFEALERENFLSNSTNSSVTYATYNTVANSRLRHEVINGERRLTDIILFDNTLQGDLVPEIGDFTELRTIQFPRNLLTSVPSSIATLTKLETLNLFSNSSLPELPQDLSALTSLQFLNVANCNFEELPVSPDPTNPTTGIGALTALEFLGFENNRITLLPDEIDNLTNLTILRASPNPFPSIPNGIGNLVNLTELNFSGSLITNVPAGVGNLVNLTELFLDNNNLQVIAENSIGNLTNLETLTLNNNELPSLPDDFGNIGTSLTTLELENNKLVSLPANFGNLTNLTTLTLTNNDLESLPESIGNINQIIELDLAGSNLPALPNSIGNMSALRILRLQSNELASLPASIGNLANLRELLLHQQRVIGTSIEPLTALPNEIGNLGNLRILSAFNVGLEALPTTLNNLINLQEATLSGNAIAGDVNMAALVNLTQLRLNNNEIASLSLGVGPSAFTRGFSLIDNPNLTCVQVPTNQITAWENSTLRQNAVDNGVLFTDMCGDNNVPQSEREALIAIYNALEGNESGWQNWDPNPNGLTNVGSWAGVTTDYIDGVKHVVELDMNGVNLNQAIRTSPMPDAVGNLPELIQFSAGGSRFGLSPTSLPESLGNLTKIEQLNLNGSTSLTALPNTIGNLVVLEILNMRSTRLINQLPDSFTNLSSLRILDANSSNLTSLPDGFGNLTALEELDFSGNGLTALPNSIGDLSNLVELIAPGQRVFQTNDASLTEIPTSLNNLINLEELDLSNNGISNAVDATGQAVMQIDLSGLTALQRLLFSNNKIQGIKIGVPASRFNFNNSSPGSRFTFRNNPNLSCIEVNTPDLTGYQNSNTTTVIDSGVIFSDDCPINNLPQSERLALIAIYNALGGDSSWTNWNPDPNSLGNVGSWAGVTTAFIDDVQRVVELSLGSSGDSAPSGNGAMPAELGDLQELVRLTLNGNSSSSLTSLPESLGNLQKLINLSLSGNANLTSLPDTFGTLSALEVVQLGDAGITALPNTLSGLTSLERFSSFRGNLITLPSSFGDLSALKSIEMSNSAITSLPDEFGNLSNLETIGFNESNLEALPETIGNLSSLRTLNARNNNLTALPASIGDIITLTDIDVSTNQITALPQELNNLTNLTSFAANDNGIEGEVNFSAVTGLSRLILSGNNISLLRLGNRPSIYSGSGRQLRAANNPSLTCIEVPTAFLQEWIDSGLIGNSSFTDSGVIVSDSCSPTFVPDAERLALIAFYNSTGGGTDWIGTNWSTDPNSMTNVGSWQGITTEVIDGVKHVTEINFQFSSPNINGPIPTEISDLPELKNLQFITDITALPESFGQLSKLENLGFSNASFTTLPDSFGDLDALTRLNISGTQLETLPESFGDLAMVTDISMTNNQITSLPASIGNLSTLVRLNMNNNNIAVFPESIGDLAVIEELNFRSNEFKSLPESLNNLNQLLRLDLQENDLEERLNLEGLTLITFLDLLGNNLITGLKLNVSVTSFGANGGGLRISSSSNSFSCLEVPTDELVSWELEYNRLPNGAVITDNCGAPEQLDRSAVVALYNTTRGINWTNNTNWLSDEPLDTWFGLTFDTEGRLTAVNLPNNNLRGFIPLQYNTLDRLETFDVSENIMSGTVPNFEASGAMPTVDISTNEYSYEDLDNSQSENNLSNFTYLPQDYPQTPRQANGPANTDITLSVDDVLPFNRSFLAPNNVYQWSKDGEEIPGANEATYIIVNNKVDDAGDYTCRITNTVLTDLDIMTAPLNFIARDIDDPVLMLVEDLIAPLDENGRLTLTPEMLDAGTTDNGGAENLRLSVSRSSYSCSEIGENEVTFTATDQAGNSASQVVTFIVEDDAAPEVTLRENVTLQLDANGMVTITASNLIQNQRDNCNIDFSFISQSDFTCDDLGINTVDVTVNDVTGNSFQESIDIMVVDEVVPSLNVLSATLILDENGTATLTTEMVAENIADNCSIDSVTLSQEEFTCDNLSNNSVTITVIDSSGNMTQRNTNVNVIDNLGPTLSNVPENFTVQVETNETYELLDYTTTVGISDNCTATPSFTQEPAAGTQLNIGDQQTVTLVGTDTFSNQTIESFIITVESTFGIEDQELKSSLTLYPMPTSGVLNIDSAVVIDNVQLYDIGGRLVATFKAPQKSLDLSQLADGLYVAEFTSGTQKAVKRIVKETY